MVENLTQLEEQFQSLTARINGMQTELGKLKAERLQTKTQLALARKEAKTLAVDMAKHGRRIVKKEEPGGIVAAVTRAAGVVTETITNAFAAEKPAVPEVVHKEAV